MSKTYRELVLDVENALKVKANLEGWSENRRWMVRRRLESIRRILAPHLDDVPTTKDSDIAQKLQEASRG
jgi:hypothetical protein